MLFRSRRNSSIARRAYRSVAAPRSGESRELVPHRPGDRPRAGHTGYELRAAVSLARLRRDQCRHAEARDLLAPVYGWFTEGFAVPDLKEAKALLDELGSG